MFQGAIRAIAGLVCVLAAVYAAAEPQSDLRARYTKQVYMIPMRDGAKLYTVVYSPKDASQPYPIMLDRTPYSVGPYEPDAYKESLGPSKRFEDDGFIFATRTCAVVTCPRASSSTCGPSTSPARARPESTRARTPMTRSIFS